jgi:putative inorganic carbon (HCO3(-)) transporter
MSFLLFLVYLGLSFLRPGEMYPELGRLGVMNVAVAITGLATIAAVLLGRTPSLRVPQPYLLAGFTLWSMLSVVLAVRWFGGALFALNGLAPSLALFVFFFLNLDTLARVRATCLALSLLSLVMVAQSVYSYHTGWRAQTFLLRQREDDPSEEVPYQTSEEGDAVAPAEEGAAGEPEGTPQEATSQEATPQAEQTHVGFIVRIRHLGFLNDPNDLAQALVSILPMLVALRLPQRRWRNALVVWLPAGALLYAVALTRSRGSIVALAVLLYLALRPKLGRTLSLVVGGLGAVGAIAFGFASGRSLAVDDSAEGRLEAWAEGLQMLKSSPVWGIGWGQFIEHNRLVAHNSFVHCFSETGLVGYFLWLSAILLTQKGLQQVVATAPPDGVGDEFRRWAQAARLGLTAFLTGAFFLSRSYSVVLFLLLGLGASVIAIADREEWFDPGPGVATWVPAIAGLSVVSVFGFWVLMKALS